MLVSSETGILSSRCLVLSEQQCSVLSKTLRPRERFRTRNGWDCQEGCVAMREGGQGQHLGKQQHQDP